MQIALVVVLGGDLVRSTEHVGIGLLSSCLRSSGHTVRVVEVSKAEVDNGAHTELEEGNFDMMGFTTSCINMSDVLKVADCVKKASPKTHIFLGGHMATFWGEKILKEYPQVDSIIYGEGEATVVELTEALKSNGGNLSEIKSLIYRDKCGVVIKNEVRPLIPDLDQLPDPDRDQFELHNHSFQYLRISSSRGCLGRCGFCSSFVGRCQPGAAWRGRSPKLVVDEIEGLVKKYNFHTFDFVDSAFEDPGRIGKQRISAIAQEILDRNLEIFYNCCFRAENWDDTKENRDLLDILIRSGLEKVNIGFESGNQRGLTILNKRASINDNHRTLKLFADFPDIYITFGFIMLHPYSTAEDLQDNADFLFGTGIGQVIRHYFWQLEVYPGTLMETML
ncbi:MAG TPA: cobalamin-dependent protein, partial [Ruminiclostridium sp.]|nr:cobalamin-dependent protein [Ruminiclostridium sp.]